MKFFALVTLSLFMAGANGQPVEQIDGLNARSLRAVMVPALPEARGISVILSMAKGRSKDGQALDKMVSEDAELTAMAKRGQEFINGYRALIEADLGAGEWDFATAPEQEILRLLRATDHSRRQDRKEAERTDREARVLALHDTATRFGLPGSVSPGDIERGRHTGGFIGEATFSYYRRQYMRYLIMPVEKPQPDEDSVRLFKKRMITRLEVLKENNLRAFLLRTKETTQFTVFTDGKAPLESRSIDDIEVEQIAATGPEVTDRTEEIKVRRNLWRRWVEFFGPRWRKKDLASAVKVYLPTWVNANTAPRRTLLKITEDRTGPREFIFKEGDVGDLISGLQPVGHFGAPKEDMIERRYLIEAGSRNAIYTDLISYLEETNDRNVDEFRLRLEARMKRMESEVTASTKTLSERIRASGVPRDAAAVPGIQAALWAGYGVHPDYWNLRGEVERSTHGERKLFEIQEAKGKATKAEVKRLKFRYRSDEQRLKFGMVRRLSQALMVGAVAGTLWSGYQWANEHEFSPIDITIDIAMGTARDAIKVPDALHNAKVAFQESLETMLSSSADGEDKESQDNADQNSATDTAKGEKKPWFSLTFNKKPSLAMSTFDAPQNFQIEKKERRGRGSRLDSTKQEANNFGFDIPFSLKGKVDDVVFYLIAGKKGEDELPRVYDLLREANLTPELLNNKDAQSEPATSAERLSISGAAKGPDFSVVTNLVHYARDGRVVIAAPDDSRLTGLVVRNKKRQVLVEGRDYKVYRLRTNHLLWIEFSSDPGGVGYKADYQQLASRPQVDRAMTQLSSSRLNGVNQLVGKIGMKPMARALDNMLYRAPDIEQLTQTFAQSATYTYDSKMWWVRGPRDNPFRPFTKFMNEEGDLNYQCSGSNAMFATYLNTYFEGTKYRADNLTAYVVTQPIPVVTLEGGHYRTVLFNSQGNEQYRVLDATPGGALGPGRGQPRIEKKPEYQLAESESSQEAPAPLKKEKEKWREIGPAILPRKPEVTDPVDVTEDDQPKASALVEEAVKPKVDLAQEELLKKLLELRVLRKRAVGSLDELAKEDHSVKRAIGFRDVPGHGAIVMARRLEDFVLTLLKEDTALAALKSTQMRWPQAGFNQSAYTEGAKRELLRLREEGQSSADMITEWTKDLGEQFKRFSQVVRAAAESPKGSDLEFALDDNYQSAVRKLITLMHETRWGVLTGSYRERGMDCEQSLMVGKAK